MERSHPPLRRVVRGEPVRVDPSLRDVSLQGENDSCYSSCSEESHPSLSRESSDALSTDMNRLLIDDIPEATTPIVPVGGDIPNELSEFARNLGYTEQQLHRVIQRVGSDAGQDRILAELVQLGRGGDIRPPRTLSNQNLSTPKLRSIIIDGSNIAMTHGRKEVFSCGGIRDCVSFFVNRGHTDVLVFVPQFRRESARADCPITDQHVLQELDQQGHIVYTPSRRINGRRIVCHDDRYILKTAEEKDAIIVSNDEYRDLLRETPQYKRLVENRLLMYSFVDGKFMPPDDPLGRHGPKLDQFLSINSSNHTNQLCPYARKCTYGNKCKYFHPERPNGMHVSITDRLMKEKNTKKTLAARPSMQYEHLKNQHHASVARTQSLNAQLEARIVNQENYPVPQRPVMMPSPLGWHNSVSRNNSAPMPPRRTPACRTSSGAMEGHNGHIGQLFAPSTAVWGHSEYSVVPMHTGGGHNGIEEADRARVQYHLCQLFPESVVMAVMAAHPDETDSQVLCERIVNMTKGFHN